MAEWISWGALALSALALFVKVVVVVVKTEQRVTNLESTVGALRAQMSVLHEDIKGLLRQ